MQTSTTSQLDKKYLQRLQSALFTAQQWDANPALLQEARSMIPHDLLNNHDDYQRDEDTLYQSRFTHPNLFYLKRLCVWFQSIMTWVNQPDCVNQNCNNDTNKNNMTLIHMRGPESSEEVEGGASRVEVYQCQNCTTTTTFPRYNAVHKLLQTLSGRCGEYANLFGLFCRAAGYDCRYVVDFTDHVWVECHVPTTSSSGDSWIMADGCEGIIQKPSMYEDGWGKELTGMVAATKDSVCDVTPRYTRKWNNPEFQAKRRSTVVSSEEQAQQMIKQLNQTLRQHLHKSRVEELVRYEQQEQKWMESYKSARQWTEEEKHGKGRISGSLEWKLARQEAGEVTTTTTNEAINCRDGDQNKGMYALSIESFYPPPIDESVSISVSSQGGIVVSGVVCAVEEATISVLVVDQHYLGCILQSRGFESWSDVAAFVDTLPNERIVALKGLFIDCKEPPRLPRLGGFAIPTSDANEETTVLCIGQVEAQAHWCVCSTEKDDTVTVRLPSKRPSKPLKLRVERNAVPCRVAARLPEHIMPLGTQLLASDEQKRTAFAKFVQQTSKRRYAGYATKDKAPVYLLDGGSFPFERSEAGWTTCHFLPEELVPDAADGGVTNEGVVTTIIASSSSPSTPSFDVPVHSEFFTQLLGPYLLTQSKDLLDTTSALSHARLVAFYFSAHWCGPCRQFTPMLAEMYDVLKESIPSHGLEIIFVSSDRDPGSFAQYYGTMPWLAVPFELGIDTIIPQLKARFGVRGIPSLVVLDTVSGQIVVPTSQTRQEVMKACQGGEDRIEEIFQDWLTRVPPETKELVEMLELSCQEEQESTGDENSYLVREQGDSKESTNVDTAERIKELFSQLVVDGEDPNKAAAKAIKMVAEEQKTASTTRSYGPGSLSGLALDPSDGDETSVSVEKAIANIRAWNAPDAKDSLQAVVSTAQKYVENARKEPWNPKFRTMKLSNKVVDRIVRVEGGLGLLLSFGFYVYPSEQDMMACIPLSVDLDGLCAQMEKILEEIGDE